MSNLKVSASQLNLFRNCPSLWVAQYRYGFKSEGGPAAWRGTAVEYALQMHILDRASQTVRETEDYLPYINQSFQGQAEQISMTRRDLEKEADELKVAHRALPHAIAAMMDLIPDEVVRDVLFQTAVSYDLDGVEVRGYMDFVLPAMVLDLKTKGRAAKGLDLNYKVQGALYHVATGYPMIFVYAWPNGWRMEEMSPEDIEQGMQAARLAIAGIKAATMMETGLLASLYPPDTDSFYWSGNEHIIPEIWSLEPMEN